MPLQEKGQGEDTDTQKWEAEIEFNEASEDANNFQPVSRGPKPCSLGSSRTASFSDTLITGYDPQGCRKTHIYLLNYLVYGNLPQWSPEMNTHPMLCSELHLVESRESLEGA